MTGRRAWQGYLFDSQPASGRPRLYTLLLGGVIPCGPHVSAGGYVDVGCIPLGTDTPAAAAKRLHALYRDLIARASYSSHLSYISDTKYRIAWIRYTAYPLVPGHLPIFLHYPGQDYLDRPGCILHCLI